MTCADFRKEKAKGRLRDDGQGGANVHKKARQKLSRFEARTRVGPDYVFRKKDL